MGDDVRRPAGGLGPSSLCLQEKKGACMCVCASLHPHSVFNSFCFFFPPPVLVSAVSVAVEAILAQFSSSRTVVQKVSQEAKLFLKVIFSVGVIVFLRYLLSFFTPLYTVVFPIE